MISKDLNVCLFPMEITWGNVESNLAALENATERIHPHTDLLVLPETFSTGFPTGIDKETLISFSRQHKLSTISCLKKLSCRHNLAICGSLVIEDKEKLYNRAFFIEPSGECIFADKRHLFSMAGENNTFTPGNKRLSVRYRGWNISMIICYDLRFPVWCRNVNNEYDLLIAVANWPEVRISAWNKLLQARAIENEAYVCGVDCKGTDTLGFNYDGSSAIIDFKGSDISNRESSGTFIYATLSRNNLDKFRKKFPAYLDADPFQLT